MHLLTTPLLGLLLSGAALAVEPQTQTTVEIFIPPSTAVANPNTLPPSTHATLVSLGRAFRAPLSITNAFVFHNVTAGSYLADVHCPTVAFAPMRIDVVAPELVVETDGKAAVPGSTAPTGKAGKGGLAPLEVHAWETYRGNDWDNKGEALVASDGRVQARALVAKAYFMERSGFSVFGILKNPMILIALVSMVLIFGLPYLIDNMDPEMKAEFEAQQKASPMNNLLRGASAGGGAPNPVSNFDMAAFLAGSNKKDSSDAQADTAAATGSSPSGGNGGGKKNGRR